MFISDKTAMRQYAEGMLLDAGLCFAASAFCALFGGIYEYFSHEVYSGYMIFAFAIPLLMGAFPSLIIALYVKRRAGYECLEYHPTEKEQEKECFKYQTDKEQEKERLKYPTEKEQQKECPKCSKEKEHTEFTDIYAPLCDKMDKIQTEEKADGPEGICIPGRISRNAWNSGLAALTVGCVFRGVLEIYGTTNRLLVVYPAVAAILLCVGAAALIVPMITVQRMKKKAQK